MDKTRVTLVSDPRFLVAYLMQFVCYPYFFKRIPMGRKDKFFGDVVPKLLPFQAVVSNP